MYVCKKCEKTFPFPDMKQIDAGHSHGILGWQKVNKNISFCPHCSSVNIEVARSPIEVAMERMCV